MRRNARIETPPGGFEPAKGSSLFLALPLAFMLALPPAHAQGDAHSGKEVVDTICAACHATGENGAPMIGNQEAWRDRASRGLSSLTRHALEGIRKMPAHGGHPELSDLEIARAVAYMVNRSGGNWVEPASAADLATERTGEQIVTAQCSKCHQEGVGGAPKIGDTDAWVQRIRKGIPYVVATAIHGHGGMPPRGGLANLTDQEIRSAILYMFNPAGGTGKQAAGAAGTDSRPGTDPNHKFAGGMEIYLGFMPAEKLRALPAGSPDRTMHGGIPEGPGYFHVNVSLYDEKSGAAITGAHVRMQVEQPGLTSTVTEMEPMASAAGSYGRYLKPEPGSRYRITVRIDRPAAPPTAVARFEHTF